MKYTKKITAFLLAVSMVFSLSGISALADEQSAVQENQEVQNILETETTDGQNTGADIQLPDTAEEAEETPETDAVQGVVQPKEPAEVTEKQKAFDYVYVDEQTVNIPEEQNIVVAFADTELTLESAVLHYSMQENGAAYEMAASNISANTVLFTKSYTDGTEAGTYQLDSITYRISGQEEDVTVDFTQQEVTAGYTVTTEPEPEESSVEESASGEAVPEITVYSIDEEGNAVEQSGESDAAETVVEETLAAADAEAAVLSAGEPEAQAISEEADAGAAASTGRSRAVTVQDDDKVIVICAGHDATHVGSSGNGLREEQLTWKVANYCKEELEKYDGVTVYLDRDSVNCAYPGQSSSYCLNQRVIDAHEKGASVFVDIHFNVVNGESTTANGAEVYIPNNSYSEEIHQDGENLGNRILEQLTALGLSNRGVKVRDCTTGETDENGILEDYYTTNNLSKHYGMTGIIVEHAFLDNAGDAAKLKNESFIKQLGVADATGIANAYELTKGTGTKNPKVTISNKDDFAGTATIKVSGVGSDGSAAIWSDVDGQDDLQWIKINGSGTISFDIKDFNNSRGTYNIHLYDGYGSGNCLLTTSFKVSEDTSSTISITNVDDQDKQFKVVLTFKDMPEEVTKVEFPTWSEENDQDDIVWYSAKQTSSGVWEATVPITSHKSTGTYHVHAYATINSKAQKMLCASTFTVSKPTISSVKVQNYDETAGTFDVVISGVSSKSGVAKVQVPVWSKSDQSDIVWYNAVKQSDGTYKVTVDIANHKNNIGTYNIHTYVTAGNGVFVFTGYTTQKVVMPDLNISVKDTDEKETTYSMTASNTDFGGTCSALQFAVWSEEGDQDDLIWYSAVRNGNGKWSATADIRKHKTAGKYQVHVYGTYSGTQRFLGATSFTVSTSKVSSVKAQNYDKNTGTFEVTVSGISSASGVSQVQVPVWSASDQSDIYWYTATKQSDGTYKAEVSIAKHKYNIGTYKIHTYVTAANGVFSFVGSTEQNVVMPDLEISATDINGNEMTYNLTASNTDFFGTCSELYFAVWSEENDQDDLIWYSAKKTDAGNWSKTMDISSHKTSGKYQVHVYGTYAGVQRFLGSTSFTVSAPTVSSVTAENYDETVGAFDVIVSGITSKSGINKVQIPVWCKSDQSDIVWYDANKQSDGTYKVTVDIANHQNHTGTYAVHVYVTAKNGIFTYTGKTSQTVTTPKELIMGTTTTTVEQMVRYFNSKASYPAEELEKGGAPDIQTFCEIYVEEAEAEGVRAEVAFAQAMKETAFLKFGGIVEIEQFNFAGLGAVDGNEKGQCASFPDVRTGVRAHIQHLKAYATTDSLNNECVDPRYSLVEKGSAKYVQWLGIQENPSGKGWASETNYGISIVEDYMNPLLKS